MAEFSFLYVISEDRERTSVEPFYENMERAEAYFKYARRRGARDRPRGALHVGRPLGWP